MRTKYLLILLPLLLILPASAEPLVKVEITNTTSGDYESLTILKPSNDQNWIKLTGGSDVAIPSIKLVYNGINSTQYTRGDKTVKIETYGIPEFQDYVVNYPFTKHPMYYQDSNVTAEIKVTSDLIGKKAYVYLIRTCPTELKNALSSAIEGDTQPLRNLLNNYVQNKTIDLSSGYAKVSFGSLPPGDYVVVATLNAPSDPNITLISATAFEVLEHKSSLNVDTLITRSSKDEAKYLEGRFEILGGDDNAKYTYVAVLIRKDAEITLKLTSKGTKATTNLTAKVGSASQEAKLVEAFKVAGVGLNKINATTVEDWLNAFPPDTVGFSVDRGVTGKTYKFKILLKGLSDGDYYLYVAAWNSSNSSQRVVAFNWTSVKIITVTPTPTPRPPVGGAGGGGYIVAPPPGVEVTYSEVKTVPANVEVKFDIPPTKAEAIGVLAVVVKVPEKMTLEVRVSKLKSLPAEVPKPPATDVYGYIDITFRKYGTHVEVEPAGYIEFKVPKSWIAEKGYDPAKVVLMKYHEGWKELKTEMTGEDENNYYYRAEIGSFSIFAIAVKTVAPVTPTPTPTPTPTVTPVTTPTVTPTVTSTPTPTPKPGWKIPGFEAALAVAALAIIALWRRR